MPLLTGISSALYRVSNIWTALLVTLVYAFFIATVMPAQSADSLSYAGQWGAPDRHFFYTPDEFYTAVSTWGDAGRADYINFRLGLDIVWALAYSGFLIGWISILLRLGVATSDNRRLLNTWPLVTLLSDYSENALCIALVHWHAERLDPLVWLAATFTSVKWLSLVLGHAILLYAIWRAIRRR